MATRESLFEVSLFGRADGQAINTVLHLMGDTAGPAPPAVYGLSGVGGIAIADWVSALSPHLSDSLTVFRVVTKTIIGVQAAISRGRPITRRIYGEVNELSPLTPQSGARAGDPTPTYVAFTCRKRTALAGKSFRGSLRAGPLAEADTTFNLVEGARLALIQTSLAIFVGSRPTPDGAVRHVVFGARRAVTLGILVEPFRAVCPPLTAMVANAALGSQVSRKRRELGLA